MFLLKEMAALSEYQPAWEVAEIGGIPAVRGRKHRDISIHQKTKANTFRRDWNTLVYSMISDSSVIGAQYRSV